MWVAPFTTIGGRGLHRSDGLPRGHAPRDTGVRACPCGERGAKTGGRSRSEVGVIPRSTREAAAPRAESLRAPIASRRVPHRWSATHPARRAFRPPARRPAKRRAAWACRRPPFRMGKSERRAGRWACRTEGGL